MPDATNFERCRDCGKATTVSTAVLKRHRGDYVLCPACTSANAPKDACICGRLLVGQGDDTYDPLCALPEGHTGSCSPWEAS